MTDGIDRLLATVDEQHEGESAHTRRTLVAGAAATLGGMGLLGLPKLAHATSGNDPQTILNVATTAEVLATIVNTVGWERKLGEDGVTQRNIKGAAREELIHYNVLVSVGGKALTKRIWVPDGVFASRYRLLRTLEAGDQIFINAYLIGTLTYGNAGNGKLAAIAAEFMGVEAVHRALARQSLGQYGNDRAFMKFDQRETAPGAANNGAPGFTNILDAVKHLQAAGFGFGAQGATPGRYYDFDQVSRRTPDDPAVNTRTPSVG